MTPSPFDTHEHIKPLQLRSKIKWGIYNKHKVDRSDAEFNKLMNEVRRSFNLLICMMGFLLAGVATTLVKLFFQS